MGLVDICVGAVYILIMVANMFIDVVRIL